MSLIEKISTKATAQINTGFGINSADYGGRFVNKDGTPNIEKKGLNILESISWYHTLLQLNSWQFFLLIFCFYMCINVIFAAAYYIIGVEHLHGIKATTNIAKFFEAYFFSAQTFTTVGYGRISPNSILTSSISAFEALVGLLSFAIATGLFYGRFSKPKAYLRFSDKAVLAPYQNGLAIMLRVAPFKNNSLLDAEVTMTAGIIQEEEGKTKNNFFRLDVELPKITSLSLNWTIVHPITENSPFFNFKEEDFINTKGELLVYIKAFDDMFNNTVVSRTSYTLQEELVIGAKFVPMYHRNNKKNKTILELDKLNTTITADISNLYFTDAPTPEI